MLETACSRVETAECSSLAEDFSIKDVYGSSQTFEYKRYVLHSVIVTSAQTDLEEHCYQT
jgi:hypothetical protein